MKANLLPTFEVLEPRVLLNGVLGEAEVALEAVPESVSLITFGLGALVLYGCRRRAR